MTVVAIFFVVCFCAIGVCPRSILPGEGLLALQVEKQNTTNVNPMKIEKVVWRKLDAIPRQDIQQPQEVNTSGIAEEDPDQLRSSQHLLEDKGQNSELSEIESTTWSEKLETEPTSWSNENAASEYSDFDQNDEFTALENLSTNSLDNMTVELLTDINSYNFTENVMHILNRTRDVLGLQSTSEIDNTTESFGFSETDTVNDMSDIAVFQDVTTSGFEFLIDSETTQNLLLAEMLGSERLILVDDDLNDSTNDDSLSEATHFISSLEIESFSNESISVESKTIALNVSKPENATEIMKTETKCPPPGWCVFWFMAQDTCAKDSHCLGSRICCKSGCSKTCLDVPP